MAYFPMFVELEGRPCLIVGGGAIAFYLSQELLDNHVRVRIVERDAARAQELAEQLPGAQILNEDGSNRDFLLSEGLESAESFVALTNIDEENVLLTLFAKKHSHGKLVTKVNRLEFDDILAGLDLGDYTSDAVQNDSGSSQELLSHYYIGIRGASGSGKSSLLNVVSGLVLPDRGTVRWGATVPGALSEHERDRWRGQHIGFVFQDFQLFPELEALENVLLPATFTGWRIPEALIRRGRGLLEQMHVCPTRKVRALSRGEKQRVAIARAVLLKPGIILADEPTASLDEANAGQVSLLLSGYARTLGSTLLVVSHDDAVLGDMDRVLDLNRGIVREAA